MVDKNSSDWDVFLADLKEMSLEELHREERFMKYFIEMSKSCSDLRKQCEETLEPMVAEIANR